MTGKVHSRAEKLKRRIEDFSYSTNCQIETNGSHHEVKHLP